MLHFVVHGLSFLSAAGGQRSYYFNLTTATLLYQRAYYLPCLCSLVYCFANTCLRNAIEPDLRVAQTGFMQGASGVGMWLLHFGEHSAGTKLPPIVFPDNPFTY
jgi:hypothetical protein